MNELPEVAGSLVIALMGTNSNLGRPTMKSNHDHTETQGLNEDENLQVIGRRKFLT